jgi:hypothetical protein
MTPYSFAKMLIYSTLSGILGAKQLVVEIMHSIFSDPSYFIFYLMASMSLVK